MKIPLPYLILLVMFFFSFFYLRQSVFAQVSVSKGDYKLLVRQVSSDSVLDINELKLQSAFNSQPELMTYVNTIPSGLMLLGFPAASVDSFWSVDNLTYATLYTGPRYQWFNLDVSGVNAKALEESGFQEKLFRKSSFDLEELSRFQDKLISFYEMNGYPFARVFLDSIRITQKTVAAKLKTEPGVLYHIDSLRVIGNAKINRKFLQRYLFLPDGSLYNKKKLAAVDKRLLELPFLKATQPSDLSMLGSGSILNLYLQQRKSSQVNFLIGFLPAATTTGKLQLTGDVNLDLKNSLGGGEGILLKWQQLQPKSPRLNLGFSQPYIFNSAFGVDFLFDLFKKDSSFLQLNAQFGLQYLLSPEKTGKLFIQWQSTTLLAGAVDTNQVIATKKLPINIDVNSTNAGISYAWLNTNYRFNPRNGNDLSLSVAVGVKTVKQNNEIVSIKDPSFNYATLYDSLGPKTYQLRLRINTAHYFPLAKSSVIKAAVTTGIYFSPAIFRNELFQIGGYRLLRGFDEESIYATRFGVFTAEYRYLFDLNSYLFLFADYGLTKNKYQLLNVNNRFTGIGLGLTYEAKLGLLNISYALGKRNDVSFNIREASKLHFGYINYF